MLLYAATIFLSAFLLFQVQPIIAKIILPWFGGSSAVWSTCMLFFQLALLAGYLYAHWLYRKLGGRKASIVHIVLLAGSLATLPILPSTAWKTGAVENPSLRILALLTVTIGLPYFLLSSTSPLLQAWYARSRKSAMPYRLFALSNFASMLALLTYPFLVEPNLTSRAQAYVWSSAYAVFVVVCGLVAFANRASSGLAAAGSHLPASTAGWRPRLAWISYAACASILLLSVTTYLTQDVAAIPFLWILPLSAYLLSFILCFDSPRYYRRAVFFPLLAAGLAFLIYRLWHFGSKLAVAPSIAILCACLFVFCMVCHGELVRRRPDASQLTSFYVSVSLGGALGGLFVGLLAPNLFNSYYELPLGLALCAALVIAPLWKETERLGVVSRRMAKGAAVAAFSVCLVFLGTVVRNAVHPYRTVVRNFYGQLRVRDMSNPADDPYAARMLVHGVINHGEQMLREQYRRTPVTYFCPQSGIGRAMKALAGPRRMGILGLGCGTLAAYGRAGDSIRIYEINPQVIQLARSEFTYLKDTPASLELALGDARLVLESESSQQFDLLVMDAFSGDSVPVHLITREAFQTYFRHLKPGGIVAVNVSNSYLNLAPVMASAAAAFGKAALLYDFYPDDDDYLCLACSWVLVMDPATLGRHPELKTDAELLKPKPGFRLWTDDYSNLFSILM